MMQKLEVGKPFPQQLQMRDGIATQPMPSGLMSLVHLSEFEKDDKAAFAGPITVAVLEAGKGIPFVAVRFHKNGLCLDGPVLVGHRPDLKGYLEQAGNALQLVILKGANYTIKRLRLLGLSDEVLEVIKQADEQPGDAIKLQRTVRRVQSSYPTSDSVYQAAQIKQDFN